MATYGGSNVVTDGLVLSLDAANTKSYPGSGTTWRDMSGNNYNSSLVNSPAFSNNSIVFDGVDDYINLGDANYVSTTTPFTICQWLNINPRPISGTQSDFHRFFTLKSVGTSTFGVGLITQIQFGYEGIYITNNNGWVRSKTSYYPTYNVWNFMCLTYNGLGSTNISNFKIYWNTQDLPFDPNNGFVPGLTADGNYLGARIPGDVQIFKVAMASFQIYNRALSATEIAQNYNAQKSRFNL